MKKNPMWYSINLIVIFTMAFSALMVSSPPTPAQAVVSFDGTIYTQNFDTLSNTGTTNAWTNDSTLSGWFIGTTANPSITNYIAGNGSGTTASFYSFGSTSATDRALGVHTTNTFTGSSGSGKNYFGVLLQNTSTETVHALSVSYHGEQWRRDSTLTQTLDFAYKTSETAIGLQDSGFTAVSGLQFVSPSVGTTSALDGNLATNSATLTATFPVYWPVNGYIMLQWVDLNNSGNDHDFSIDDVSVQVDYTDYVPTITSSTPTNGATGVAADSNITLNFSEPVTATAGWYSLTCGVSGAHTATETVSEVTYTLNPDVDFGVGETCTLTVDNTKVADTDGTPNNMAAPYVLSFSTPAACGSAHTAISAIQGSGTASTMTSSVVTVEGIVAGKFNVTSQLGGFFLNSLPADVDAATDTSEGIFVYTGGTQSYNVGDWVRLKGTVSEYTGSTGGPANQTQLSSISDFMVCGTGYTPAITTVTLPIPGDPASYLERYEGMLVNISDADSGPLVVLQNYFQGRLGQLTMGTGKDTDRMFHAYNGSDSATYMENLQRLVVLDDGSSYQNPNPISYLATNGAMRAGDSVASLTGILDQGKTNASTGTGFPYVYYRLQPVIAPVFIQTNPRLSEPAANAAEVRVAAANVLNYFTTLGSAGRGASNDAELIRQRCKMVAELSRLDADVIGLLEIENNGLTAINNLLNYDDTSASNCDGLNLVLPGTDDDYAVIADPDNGYGGDQIKGTIIYRPSRVTPVGSPLSLITAPFDAYRPPVAQKFVRKDTGESFIYIINHFKSKSCSGSPTGGDADLGEGRGCFNETRINMSVTLLNWINTILVPLSPNVVTMGDYNAYGAEPPIATLTAELTSMAEALLPPEERYSYVFDGMVGDLDHGFATPALATQAVTMTIWHINADEPSVTDYNTEYKNPDLYQPDPYRAADHDPLLVDFNLNDAPVAVSDTYHTQVDVTLTVSADDGVVDNDTDSGNDTLTVTLVDDVDHGTLVLNPDGSFVYTPAAIYYGADSFIYRVSDGQLEGNTATVDLMVNNLPVATGESYSTDEDTPLTVTATVGVLDNDTDVETPTLTAVLTDDVDHGSLTLNLDGSFSYTPAANYNGSDSFMYSANDGLDNSSSVTVNLTVNMVNDAPVAAGESYDTDVDVTLTVTATLGVLANDTDAENTTLTASLTDDVDHGALVLNADGSFTYTPAASYYGADSFVYKASDGEMDSDPVTVNIIVNDLPVANGDSYSVTEDITLIATTSVLANDVNHVGSLTAVLTADAAHGALTFNADGTFTYTPAANYNGADSFMYKAYDNLDYSSSVTVTLTVNAVNDTPAAAGEGYSVDEDATLNVTATVGVLANDSDPVEGSPLTAVLADDVDHGVLALNADGSFIYTPTANYNGADSFMYRANDGLDNSSSVTVTLTVNAVNDAPVAVGEAYSTNEDATLTVTATVGVLANDTDVDSTTLTAVLADDVDHGVLVLNADGSFIYTPTANYNGADSFMYKANDGSADSSSVTVTLTVNVINDAPVAVGEAYSTNEDATLTVTATVGVLANDTDVDSTTLTAVLADDVDHGVLVLNADGSFTYTPTANFNGADSFMYKANDGSADSSSVTVTLTVNAVNDAPVLATSLEDDSWLAFSAGSYTFASDAFTDVDSTLTYTATLADGSALPAWLSFDGGTRTFSGTPTNLDAGTLTIKVTASDGSLSVNDTFTLTIVKFWFNIFMPFISMPELN